MGGSGKRTNSRGGGSVEPLAAAELSDNAIADAVWEAADAARAAVRSTPLAACALLDGGGSSDAALATDADGYATPEVCSSLLTFYIGMQARCKGVMLNVSFLCYCAARPGPGAAAETSGATCLCSSAARAAAVQPLAAFRDRFARPSGPGHIGPEVPLCSHRRRCMQQLPDCALRDHHQAWGAQHGLSCGCEWRAAHEMPHARALLPPAAPIGL